MLVTTLKTPTIKQLLFITVPAVSILILLAAAIILFEASIAGATRDMAATAQVHPLTGFLSNIGILAWCLSSSICIFSAVIAYSAGSKVNFLFLLCSALLTAYLLFDDFFMLHEFLASHYLGISENAIYGSLGISLAAYLIAFRQKILTTNFLILCLGLGFLALSVVVDSVTRPIMRYIGEWQYFLEDGAKWMGIAFWSGYFFETSYQLVREDLSAVKSSSSEGH